MTDWTDIHEDFGKEQYDGKTYQQIWEQANITKKEAKKWIAIGFEPNGLYYVEEWKNFNFSPIEMNVLDSFDKLSITKTWLEVGLDKNDWEFASWLRTNNHAPELVKNNLEQLRSGYNQYFLTKYSPDHNIKELDINHRKLKGELNLSQYQQLERLNCSRNKLTNIILPTSLKELNLGINNFNQDLSFLVPYTSLEELRLENNKFTGSLDYLSGMEKLKWLDISNTDINEVNIDKLPRSLKEIGYSTDKRPDCKLTAIISLLDKVRYGFCPKCYQPNTSENWCQPCAEKEWKKRFRAINWARTNWEVYWAAR